LLTDLPFGGNDSGGYLEIEGHPIGANQQGPYANYYGISPGTFKALRVPLVNGRNFNAGDDAKALSVAIVNKHFADQVFPRENPIGKRFKGVPLSGWTTIIGVIGDIKNSSLDQKPELDTYFNYPQFGVGATGVV